MLTNNLDFHLIIVAATRSPSPCNVNSFMMNLLTFRKQQNKKAKLTERGG
jgi:hypothetical protein